MLCVATALASPAQILTTLVNFDGSNGRGPELMSLIQGTDGNLYGTTALGDTIFKMTPAGVLTTLYTLNNADGLYPTAGLVQASDGNFYGTTEEAGASVYGTIFKITPEGTLTTLYNFCAKKNCRDGAQPDAALIQGSDRNLYGTTQGGGATGFGTVFKITLSGTLTTLYSFCAQTNCADNSEPTAQLVQATDGNFYGTTYEGGTTSQLCSSGCGTVFKLTPTGVLTTLHSFDGTDGYNIVAGIIQGTDGSLYGTTQLGGAYSGGTIFKITKGGVFATLHSFNNSDGSNVYAGLTQATDGNIYGATYYGGTNNEGTIFRITPAGALTTLYNFCAQTNCTDGEWPSGGLMQATNGKLYGTTVYGGVDNYGLVFSLTEGLGPFVETRPTSGKVGDSVIVLGSNLAGTTAVTFNGTPATFKIVSKGTGFHLRARCQQLLTTEKQIDQPADHEQLDARSSSVLGNAASQIQISTSSPEIRARPLTARWISSDSSPAPLRQSRSYSGSDGACGPAPWVRTPRSPQFVRDKPDHPIPGFLPHATDRAAPRVGHMAGPMLEVVAKYKETLKKYPNPPAANLTKF